MVKDTLNWIARQLCHPEPFDCAQDKLREGPRSVQNFFEEKAKG